MTDTDFIRMRLQEDQQGRRLRRLLPPRLARRWSLSEGRLFGRWATARPGDYPNRAG